MVANSAHPAHSALTGEAASSSVPVPDQDVVRQAAHWMARLWSDEATAADAAACSLWRSQRQEHELAWQRLQAVGHKFADLPDPAGRHALKAAPEKLRQMRRNSLKMLGVLLLTGGGVELGRRTEAWQALSSDYASGVGEIRELRLPDGTQLVLNTNSAVDIVYTGTARRVELRFGEILIATAPDNAASHRPFSVTGRDGEVLALGTRFLVRQRENATAVTVIEGAVEVRPRHTGAVLRIEAGYQADFASDSIGQARRRDDNAGNWSRGLLVAEQMPLSALVEELGRYRHGVVRCAPAIADLKVSGVFSLRDTDRALSNLTLGLPLQLDYRTRYWVSVMPRPDRK